MKTRVLLIPVVALVLASCGDDKKSDSTTADTAAADTSVADTTPAEQPTTTVVVVEDPVAARVATAQEIAGTYTGEWHNTTFASNGSIDATFTVDATTATATLTMDLGGNVFGAPDPQPLTAEFDLNGEGPYTGTNDVFGDFTVSYSDGHLSFEAAAVPGVGGKKMTLDGDFADGGFTGTYTIVDLAEGTFEATRA